MSPNFQEVVLLADGLQLAVKVPGNAGLGVVTSTKLVAVERGWVLMLSNAQLKSEKI
jgi:hypothetical protein